MYEGGDDDAVIGSGGFVTSRKDLEYRGSDDNDDPSNKKPQTSQRPNVPSRPRTSGMHKVDPESFQMSVKPNVPKLLSEHREAVFRLDDTEMRMLDLFQRIGIEVGLAKKNLPTAPFSDDESESAYIGRIMGSMNERKSVSNLPLITRVNQMVRELAGIAKEKEKAEAEVEGMILKLKAAGVFNSRRSESDDVISDSVLGSRMEDAKRALEEAKGLEKQGTAESVRDATVAAQDAIRELKVILSLKKGLVDAEESLEETFRRMRLDEIAKMEQFLEEKEPRVDALIREMTGLVTRKEPLTDDETKLLARSMRELEAIRTSVKETVLRRFPNIKEDIRQIEEQATKTISVPTIEGGSATNVIHLTPEGRELDPETGIPISAPEPKRQGVGDLAKRWGAKLIRPKKK